MERLRQLTAGQRFAVVLAGIVVGNVGRVLLAEPLQSLLIVLGAGLAVLAVGGLELGVHLWHAAKRRLAS